jgi:hypothetical protein
VRRGSLLKFEVIAPQSGDAKPPDAGRPSSDSSQAVQQTQDKLSPSPAFWRYASEGVSGPDGDYASNINIASLITEKAPVGALIGKIGGSTSGKDDGALIFCVGSFCVFRLSDSQEGALFLTINDSPKGFRDNDGQMLVNVYEGL